MIEETKPLSLTLEGATRAPTLLFDEAPLFGVMAGQGRVTLSTIVQDENGQGHTTAHRVAIVHLRGSAASFTALRNAIDNMLLLLAGADEPKGPTN